MPSKLASDLRTLQHNVEPLVTIESPYDTAPDKILSPAEVRRLRSAVAKSSSMPTFIDSLTIQSPTSALARRTTSRAMLEYRLVKHGERWTVEGESRSEIVRPAL